ncbi:MBL fold metallo-hydrolase [Streptomyces sp. 891-h]|uniref:MBL fold metallo-hydrolase n=1 Tax=Streptomyces sp. 891-h TaxID=2720714 RepID=UPI001FA9F198|nr:MBL fold metallo-hydrolase [Streptomyces sp. 891-h]UNZ16003.1 MBL fold metallo-hydrolase [Streptomyces sp. 891-h]
MTGSAASPTSLSQRWLRPLAFGADPAGERMERIRRSPHFADGTFRNPESARIAPSGSRLEFAKAFFRKEARRRRRPAAPIPLHRGTLDELGRPPASGLRLTWMGHSSVLAEIDGRRVLFDPVWGRRCSPFAFAGPKRLHAVPVPIASLGPVDVVVISHDHYDHLDMPTIRALASSDTVFAVPLGVGAHLERWGVSGSRLLELDWHESARVGGLQLTATPARHFCGRGLRNRQHTLWASWVVQGADGHRVYHSGDTGYFPGFRDIGAEHGPFDATMIQIGAYSEYWPDIHMTPAEGMKAHLDLQQGGTSGVMLPIHWGTFNLALHPWDEPAEGTRRAAEEAAARAAFPLVGEPFEPTAEQIPTTPWWRSVAAAPTTGDSVGSQATPTGRAAPANDAVETSVPDQGPAEKAPTA